MFITTDSKHKIFFHLYFSFKSQQIDMQIPILHGLNMERFYSSKLQVGGKLELMTRISLKQGSHGSGKVRESHGRLEI